MALATQTADVFDAIINKRMLPYQRAAILNPARFGWYCWSRQVGKSDALSFRRIARGIARKKNQLFLSASKQQSRELMMKAKDHCELIRAAFKFTFREGEEDVFEGVTYRSLEIQFENPPVRIIGLPANPRTARGFTGDVFLDEFAMHEHGRKIWASIFPSVLRAKGELDVASTPRGKQNKFYELANNDRFAHDVTTIEDAVRQGLEGIDLEELREAMGDDMFYRQEFLCEFIDEATAFLTLDLIFACEDPELAYELDLDALASHKGDVLVGMDIGRRRDLTVIWALDSVGEQLNSLGLIEMVSTPFREQFQTLCDVLECKCVRKCCIDESGLGMQLAEQAVERYGEHRVEPHTFTANLKEALAGKLRVKMEGGSARIPADKRIRDDLHSIEKSVTIDGKIRLRATRQEGSHADRFWALALAVYAAADHVGPIEATFGPDLHIGQGGAW